MNHIASGCSPIYQDCGNGQGYHLSGLGWMLVILGVVLFCVIGQAVKSALGIEDSPAKEPRTDMSPLMAILVSGRSHDGYTAPAQAATPAGITVRGPRCCDRGHQSPQQAVDHAARVQRRIERIGRWPDTGRDLSDARWLRPEGRLGATVGGTGRDRSGGEPQWRRRSSSGC